MLVFIIVLALVVIGTLIWWWMRTMPTINWVELESESFRLNDSIDKDVMVQEPHKWVNFYNPSIVKFGDDMLVIARINIENFIPPQFINTLLIQKISQCDPRRRSVVLSKPFPKYRDWVSGIGPLGFIRYGGYEDPRIFLYRGTVYTLVTIGSQSGGTFVYLARISPDLMSVDKIVRLKPLNPASKKEKNWNPLIPEKELFVTNIQPHTVIRVNMDSGDTQLAYKTESPHLKKLYPGKFTLRGSTKYVETNQGYLAVAHFLVTKLKVARYYFNIFYMVEKNPPYRIVSFSNPFRVPTFTNKGIQFVAGLERVDNKLWLSYGDNDKTGNIAVVDLNYALHLAAQKNALENS